MPRFEKRRCLFAAVLLACAVSATAVAQTTVEVVPLKYRKGEQILPMVQQLLGRESSVSNFQNQLVIRATPAELAQIKRVLASLDTPPRRLLITVRQDADLERKRREAELSSSIGNDNARVTIPGSGSRAGGNVVLREGDDRLRARIIDSQQISRDSSTQTIQVLEGKSAYIRTGESRPVRNRQVVRTVVNGQIVDRVVESTEYRDASTGFHVLPRIQGDVVTLDIDPQRESFDDLRRGTVNVQRVVTTVSGRLGEWIDLGGIGESRSDERSALLGRSSGRVSERSGVQVKVEELP
ncbi:MAG: secretin N-terminal domain-containing protein [Burkholderiales bacterium]